MKLSYELFGTPEQVVMDPLHGGIPFFDHEQVIMDHPLFQRLRHIGQNDVTSLVFPGATHSRFLHSIGTTHVASKIFKGLIRSYLLQLPEAIRPKLRLKHVQAIQYFHYILRIATLLHDVGHLPFSHYLEKEVPEIKAMLSVDMFKVLWHGKDAQRYYPKMPVSLDHEFYSVICAWKIFEDSKNTALVQFEVDDVLGVMDTTDVTTSERFAKHARNLLPLFFKNSTDLTGYPAQGLATAFQRLLRNIITSELGADRMDYMLRDSYFSGSKYGVYNLDHLVSNLRVGFDVTKPNAPWVGIAVTEKGLGALEDFVSSRFQLYLHVYNHKTVVGMKILLTRAIQEVIGDKRELSEAKLHLSDLNKFVHFTDTYFWEKLRRVASRDASSACAMLVERRKLKWLQTEKDLPTFKKDGIKAVLEEEWNGTVTYKDCTSKFSKIHRGSEEIRLLIVNRKTGATKLDSIYDGMDFFDKFKDTETTHFYQLPLEWNKDI